MRFTGQRTQPRLTDLPSEMLAADSQMTTGFFRLRPVKGWETNHSQMTTRFFTLQSWMLDARYWMLDAGCETIEDRGRKTEDGGRIQDKHYIRSSKQIQTSNDNSVMKPLMDTDERWKSIVVYNSPDFEPRLSEIHQQAQARVKGKKRLFKVIV